jgi:predicted MFS family arabinose efflux permease
LLGGAESFVVTGALAWGIAAATPRESGRVIAWMGVAMYAAFAIGAPIGSFLYALKGFTAVAVATFVVPAMALPLLRRVPAGVAPPQPSQPRSSGATLQVVWRPGLGLALSSLGFAAVTTFITLLFVSRDWAPSWAGFSAFAGAFVMARVVGAHLPDRFGGARVALYSLLVEVLGLIVVSLAQAPLAAMAGAVLTGLGYSLVFPGLGLEVVRHAPPGQRALALGTYTACLDLALGVAGPSLGLLADEAGLSAVFGASALLVLLAAAVALRLMRRAPAAMGDSIREATP